MRKTPKINRRALLFVLDFLALSWVLAAAFMLTLTLIGAAFHGGPDWRATISFNSVGEGPFEMGFFVFSFTWTIGRLWWGLLGGLFEPPNPPPRKQ